MIKVDISNVWGSVEFGDLMAIERETAAAHAAAVDPMGPYRENIGWMTLPGTEPAPEFDRMLDTAAQIRAESDVLVVVGVGGACLGARAAVELLTGSDTGIGKGKGDPEILWAGGSLSSRSWAQLNRLLADRDFSVALISRSGVTMEPAVASRSLRWMLERKYGTDGARKRIYAVTDPVSGPLRKMADDAGWNSFRIPPTVSGRFAVLTAAGLLPMAAAGIDIRAMADGAAKMRDASDLRSYENPAWLYAAVRNLMYRNGKQMELLTGCEPGFRTLGRWWQQLFAESEGKNGRGLFPVPVELTEDLHTVGQMIQQGPRNLFETVVRFDPPVQGFAVLPDAVGADGLDYLAGKTLDEINACAMDGAAAAHADAGVPEISVSCGPLSEESLGALFYFLQLSCGISAVILGVNPYTQPGVEPGRSNMYRLLGRPGYE